MALLTTGMHPFQPVTMANAPDGVLYVANGLDRPRRWDGSTLRAENAGVDAPNAACSVASSGDGPNYGTYKIYTRYTDDSGVPSNFSPVVSTTITSGAACTTFTYTNIPTTSDPRMTKTQVWRNTTGQEVTWYLDQEIDEGIETTTSTRTDSSLVQQTALRYFTEDHYPNARRFGPPPDWMGVVVTHGDRMYYSVPTENIGGRITVAGTTVTGTGVRFTPQMKGRDLLDAGFLKSRITSVTSGTVLKLSDSQSTGFGTSHDYYAISKGPDERNRIYFSEIGEPESFPIDDSGNHVNVLQTQEDGDQLRAMMSLGSYLFLFKDFHIYRMSTAGDPRRDATFPLVAERGCLNAHCWTRVEGVAFVLDRSGAYIFDGSNTQSISGPVQDFWRGRINWDFAKAFSVEHAPDEELVRFFVAIDTDLGPKHVLVYNYRLKTWDLEEYQFNIRASAVASIAGEPRVITGADGTIQLIGEGTLDGCAPYDSMRDDTLLEVDQTVRGTVTSANTTSLTDSSADFTFTTWHANPADYGAPVIVIDADGDIQTVRLKSISGTTLRFNEAITAPSVGDTYQIGGIPWQAKLGTFGFLDRAESNKRRTRLKFTPQSQAGTANLKLYLNQSNTAEVAGVSVPTRDGLIIRQNSANIQHDLTKEEGEIPYDFSDGLYPGVDAARAIDIELRGVSGLERTKIQDLLIDGVYK